MMPVRPAPEYAQFDQDVRQKGQAFLLSCPNPSSEQFRGHSYWRQARDQLHAAYGGFCAYTTKHLYYPEALDHFLPKSRCPQLAYEWSNYRLAQQRVNAHKGTSLGLLDPFCIQRDWFTLAMPSCLIRPAPHLTNDIRSRVTATIEKLKLNDDYLVSDRCSFLVNLADGQITMQHLEEQYPFLAYEVKAQGKQQSLRQIFSRL